MQKKMKKVISILLATFILTTCIPLVPVFNTVLTVEAHSGRTDGSGGIMTTRIKVDLALTIIIVVGTLPIYILMVYVHIPALLQRHPHQARTFRRRLSRILMPHLGQNTKVSQMISAIKRKVDISGMMCWLL